MNNRSTRQLVLVGLCVFALSLGDISVGLVKGADVPDEVYLKRRGPGRRKAVNVKTKVDGKVGEVVVVGNQPEGYGAVVIWNRKENANIFVCYLAAKDDLGVAILNLKKGDRVEVMAVDGKAEFSGSKGPFVESIIGLVATAGAAGAAALGVPEASPFIKAGGDFAAKEFGKKGKCAFTG
jgi:hypothetical protein